VAFQRAQWNRVGQRQEGHAMKRLRPESPDSRLVTDRDSRPPIIWAAGLTGLFLVGSFLPSAHFFSDPEGYLPLHVTLEFVSMAISVMVFALAWNLRHIEGNSQIVVLGVFSLVIAVIDLAHTLSFPGMPVFVTASGTEKVIFFWLIGRFVAAIALLIVAVLPIRHWRVQAWLWLMLSAIALICLVLWVGLYHLDSMPTMFIAGEGLTSIKIDSEYIIAGVYALSAVLLLVRSRRDSPDMLWLAAGAWTLALAELFFTLYTDMTDVFNLLGHLYKAAAYFMVYLAIFAAGVRQPYRQLAQEQSQLRSLLDSVPDLVSIKDHQGRYIGANQAYTTFTGLTETELVGHTAAELGHLQDGAGRTGEATALESGESQRFAQWISREGGGGAIFDTMVTSYFSSSGERLGIIELSRDITEQTFAEERIQRLALFDQLTGLPNRLQFRDRVTEVLAADSGRVVAILYLDIDDFRTTNDTVGHRIGDLILEEAGRRVAEIGSEQDLSARLGGDEFAVMLLGADAEAAANAATRLCESFSEPFRVGEYELTVTASIGIALSPADGTDFEALSRGADTAMFTAKQQGHNTYRFVTEAIQTVTVRRLQLVTALRSAIGNDELVVHYQPQVSLADGRIVGAEALLRWQHPEFGLLPPASFITLAEDSGLILPIGDWVLRKAMTDAQSWQGLTDHALTVAVNISAVQFLQNDLPSRVSSILRETSFPAQLLDLEITESVAMRNPETAAAMLDRLRRLGVSVSIDDFGTGYSSMAYLSRFAVNRLKIDRSFVEELGFNTDDEAIVVAIIQLAKSLRCSTIAEGVETPVQRAFLADNGCDQMQGFVFSRALPEELFRSLLQREASELQT
jgi:diguanylate cyclase (GGDEF)-like protein/PAS domain S-box-containing protein